MMVPVAVFVPLVSIVFVGVSEPMVKLPPPDKAPMVWVVPLLSVSVFVLPSARLIAGSVAVDAVV